MAKSAMKAMKAKKVSSKKKAMKGMKKAKKVSKPKAMKKKKKKVSVVARGIMRKWMVFKGAKERTVGGLKKSDLTKVFMKQ